MQSMGTESSEEMSEEDEEGEEDEEEEEETDSDDGISLKPKFPQDIKKKDKEGHKKQIPIIQKDKSKDKPAKKQEAPRPLQKEEPQEKGSVCPVCKRKFNSEQACNQHIQSKHAAGAPAAAQSPKKPHKGQK